MSPALLIFFVWRFGFMGGLELKFAPMPSLSVCECAGKVAAAFVSNASDLDRPLYRCIEVAK